MHVELIAPFRTLFNLNTDIAETHLNAAVRVLDATATQYAAETGERTFTPLQPTPSGGSLAGDRFPSASLSGSGSTLA